MINLDIPRYDKNKETGVWKKYYNIELLIARIGGQLAQDARKKWMQKFKDGYFEKTELDEKVLEEIGHRVISEGVLLDWRNVHNAENGEPVVYTPETGYEVLTNSEYEELYKFIIGISQDFENYRIEIRDNAKKK